LEGSKGIVLEGMARSALSIAHKPPIHGVIIRLDLDFR
jgi:hypothetical protein